MPTIRTTIHTDHEFDCSRCGDEITGIAVQVETTYGDVDFDENVCRPCLNCAELAAVLPKLSELLGPDFIMLDNRGAF